MQKQDASTGSNLLLAIKNEVYFPKEAFERCSTYYFTKENSSTDLDVNNN